MKTDSEKLYILDTSALLVHFKEEFDWAKIENWFIENQVKIGISVISLVELHNHLIGLDFLEREREQIIDTDETSVDYVMPVDSKVAKMAIYLQENNSERLPLAMP